VPAVDRNSVIAALTAGDGGPALRATLDYANAVAVDAAGTVYMADNSARIRRVDTHGIITTIAGGDPSLTQGDGGPALRARVNAAVLAVGPAGDLYLGGQDVRRINRAGIITTLIGSSSSTSPHPPGDGGPARAGAVQDVTGLAVDAAGNIYIADLESNRVRRIDARGIVTTVAGTGAKGFSGDGGPAAAATLSGPRGVAVDAAGNLYIADAYNRRIRRVGRDGIITTIVGGGTQYASDWDGIAAHLLFWDPDQIAVDSAGTIYIGDTPQIIRIDPNGHGRVIARSFP